MTIAGNWSLSLIVSAYALLLLVLASAERTWTPRIVKITPKGRARREHRAANR